MSRIAAFVTCVFVLSAADAFGRPPKAEKKAEATSELAVALHDRNKSRMEKLGGELAPAELKSLRADAHQVQEWVAAYADPVKDAPAFLEAALGVGAADQIGALSPEFRKESVKILSAAPMLATTLLLLVDTGKRGDTIPAVYATLSSLAQRFGAKKLDDYAQLASAICVVHDRKLVQRVNENSAEAPPAPDVFDYYTRNEAAMRFGVKGVPAELLVFVVDCCASLSDMQWAFQRYGSSPIGPLYMQVRYDYEHLLVGREKQVTAKGFSLQNVLKWGGICADQAYFSSTVGKAVGVPSVYYVGEDGSSAHAWLGYLRATDGRVAWDFESGRYPEYKNVRGRVQDPQTGAMVADGFLTVLCEGMKAPPNDRRIAGGIADAGRLLGAAGKTKGPYPPDNMLLGEAFKPNGEARPVGIASALTLLEAAARRCPGLTSTWGYVGELAKTPAMTQEQRARWAGALADLCGKSAPDFTFSMLSCLVVGVDDPQKQSELWDKVMPLYQQRHDLAAAARYMQGTAWEKAGKLARAWDDYQKVIDDYANDTPYVVGTLVHCEQLLAKNNKHAEILPMYERAWRKILRPDNGFKGVFATQSNWYRVGVLYNTAAKAEGDLNKSKQIETQLSVVAKPN